MELINDLFNNLHIADRYKPSGKKLNQRGELLRELSEKTGLPIPRLANKLEGMDDPQTLYYILSRITDDVKTGRKKSYLHAFNNALYVEK